MGDGKPQRGATVLVLKSPIWGQVSQQPLSSELEEFGCCLRVLFPGGRGGARMREGGRPNSALCPQCVPVPMGWPAQLGVSAATLNAWGAAAGQKTPGPAWPVATSTSRAPATGPALQAPTSMSPGAVSRQSTVPACAPCPAAPPPSASTGAAAWPSAPRASPAMAAGECRGVGALSDQ